MRLILSEADSCRPQREERDSLEHWEDDGGAAGQKHRRIPFLLPSSMTGLTGSPLKCLGEWEARSSHERSSESIERTQPYSSAHTSNDLLSSLGGERFRRPLNYEIVAQSAEEVQDTQNAPAVSMGPYLVESGQTQLLTTISIYSERGESRE
jgi:hypothetical protein